MVEPDYDVVVIGAGGAGMAAAVTAAETGRTVLLAEAAAEVGGATALSGGSFMAAGTPVQAAAGYPDDSADAFFDHYLSFNQWDVEPAIARRFCDLAAPTFRWLTEIGVEFPVDGLYRSTRESAPRSHRPRGFGAGLVAALRRRVGELPIDVALGQRVEGLERDGDALRVRASGDEVVASAVVLCTGGFGANPDLVAEYLPEAGGHPVWSPTPATNVGDGLAVAVAVGAGTAGIGHGDVLLTAGLIREVEPYPPAWLLMVGRHGRRFVDEGAPYAVTAPLSVKNGPCWVILDDIRLRTAAPPSHVAWGVGTWCADVLVPAVEDGRVVTASTPHELATAIDVPPAALAATVDRYNSHCDHGADPDHFKDPAALIAMRTPPFHAVWVSPSVVALTGYGVRIDTDGRVLAAVDGAPIPGLFAAGEVTGNVIGPQYLGGGNAVGSALIFGRVAGRSAAGHAARHATAVRSSA